MQGGLEFPIRIIVNEARADIGQGTLIFCEESIEIRLGEMPDNCFNFAPTSSNSPIRLKSDRQSRFMKAYAGE